jgi:Flp pilus assembly pilin Flp
VFGGKGEEGGGGPGGPFAALAASAGEKRRAVRKVRMLMQSPVAVAAFRWIAQARLRKEAEGQDLLEYALLCGLIALVALGAVTVVGQTINTVFWQSIAQNF